MMTQSFPEPKPNQHSRLTLDEAITQYKANLLTAQGLIYHAVKIYRKDGHKFRIKDVSAFCQRLKIHRSTFYKALLKLEKADVGFHWEPEDGLNLWFEDDANQQQVSPIGDKCRQLATSVANWRQVSPTGVCESPIGDNQFPKTAPCKDCSVSSNIYQIFINSLSDSERENFLEFGKKKAAQLPKPPELPLKWIEANWEELRSQWEKTEPGRTAKNSQIDWTQHPNWPEWLDFMRTRGVPTFVALGEWLDRKTRREIADWADERNLVWGAES